MNSLSASWSHVPNRFPPPLHHLYSWRVAPVSLRSPRCKHLRSGTPNSFNNAAKSLHLQHITPMSKRFVHIHKAVACPVVWEAKWSSPHMFKTANPPGRTPSLDVTLLCCQDVDPCELTWSSNCSLHFTTNNQCYFIFNRLVSPNKGKYF